MDTNPLKLVEDLRSTLQRYIPTTLPISRNYPQLRQAFNDLLANQDENPLVKGPYLEALHDFRKGRTLNQLVKKNGGFLHDSFSDLPYPDRKLHSHQEQALRKACEEYKSLVVATGTGSGKTETFLYPIINALLNDPTPEIPGVRALLIYPMNALANDQLFFRIAPLLGRYLSAHNITFGRYTGAVSANTGRDEEQADLIQKAKLMEALGHPAQIPANWLLTRDEMLANPPKVLVTNYAMLEHILLLPRNESLFANNQTLRFIVLDEIHSYTGAQATEVAYLIRKLKNRLKLEHQVQVFGTSASLSSDTGVDEKLKAFASDLFGETVTEVIRGERLLPEALTTKTEEFSLSLVEWIELGNLLKQLHHSNSCAEWNNNRTAYAGLMDNKFVAPQDDQNLGSFLKGVFANNRELRATVKFLEENGVSEFQAVAASIFSDTEDKDKAYDALAAVVSIGMRAKVADGEFPLFPARYHIATNSIEGVSVLLGNDNDKEGFSQIRIARHYTDLETRQPWFPLLVCRKCGQPYLEGFEHNNRLFNTPQEAAGRTTRKVYWLGSPVVHILDEDDEEEDVAAQAAAIFHLDLTTHQIGPITLHSIPLHSVSLKEDEQDQANYVSKCPACGGRASGADSEVVTRMTPGNEALGSVIVQKVLGALPAEELDRTNPKPFAGRAMLCFSDNRQDAGFFAPYFQNTSANITLRTAIFRQLKLLNTSTNIEFLSEEIIRDWSGQNGCPMMLNSEGELIVNPGQVKNILLPSIGAEFCTATGRRNSLESLGLVKVTYDANKLTNAVNILHRTGGTIIDEVGDDLSDLIHFMLETIRREKAIVDLYGADLQNEFIWGSFYKNHRAFVLEQPKPNGITHTWLTNRKNRRTHFLRNQLGFSTEASNEFLRNLWAALIQSQLLVNANPGFGLPGNSILLQLADENRRYVCTSCGLLHHGTVLNKCTAFGCNGTTEPLSSDEFAENGQCNHYLYSYINGGSGVVRAKEHTASLSNDLRAKIEEDFAKKQINLLSCTTTMEMGVDLGDLEAVVNLNVPPTIANYQQRTGRAGRRAQAAPFCVTIARNSPFDQAVFRQFKDYLEKEPTTPFVHLQNPDLFYRHQQSVLLSAFLRQRIQNLQINAPRLKDLFGDTFNDNEVDGFREALQGWLESEDGVRAIREAESLIDRLPTDNKVIGARDYQLKTRFIEAMYTFASEVGGKCTEYQKYIDENLKDPQTVAKLMRATYWANQQSNFIDQFLVNQFSVRGLIPTYSFPTHSITLTVVKEQNAIQDANSDVELTRDASMGISEYAPGSEVVANGRIWTSVGIAYYPKQFMPERWFATCPNCFKIDVADMKESIPNQCSNCGCTDNSQQGRWKRKFIQPKGFVTAYDNRNGKNPSTSRRRVKPADEARLIIVPREELFEQEATGNMHIKTALLPASSPADEDAETGKLFIVNRGAYGQGYKRCPVCSYTHVAPVNANDFRHNHPRSGERCPGTMPSLPIDLAHEFQTDVRIFRFLHVLPRPSEEFVDNPKRFYGGFSRTLAEALRFAAAAVLDIDAREIRSTYRYHGGGMNYVEIVIYDAAAGGAGYSKRLGSSIEKLIEQLKQRLTCTCTSGCRKCLADYSNQRWWDIFDRVAVLNWLESFDDKFESLDGLSIWQIPSLLALRDIYQNTDQIWILGSQLFGEVVSTDVIKLLNFWNGQQKTVHIIVTQDFKKWIDNMKNTLSVEMIETLMAMVSAVKSDKIKFYSLLDNELLNISRLDFTLPRLFSDGVDSPIILSEPALTPIFENLLAAHCYKGQLTDKSVEFIRQLIATAVKKPVANTVLDALFQDEKFKLVELKSNAPRSFASIFEMVKNKTINKLVIKDPYCATSKSGHYSKEIGETIEEFVSEFIDKVGGIKKVIIECREQPGEHYFDVTRQVENKLAGLGFINENFAVKVLRISKTKFHDREVLVETENPNGTSEKIRFILTGGIDSLMNPVFDTKVFVQKFDT